MPGRSRGVIDILPVPEIGLNLIGKEKIRGWVDLHGGYNNRVWKVFGHDGAWILKSYRSAWLCRNEAAAIRCLGPKGLAPARFHAQSATVLIWPDDGLTGAQRLNEGLARAMGHALRRLHDSSVGPLSAQDDAGWRLVDRIGKAAGGRTGYKGLSQGPIHGDARLGNVLVDGAGRFVRFSDFEEYGVGDQAADLVLCLVESACDDPRQACQMVDWVVCGYMAAGPGRLSELLEQAARSALATAALDELAGWAEENGVTALIERYEIGAAAALKAVNSLAPSRFLSGL